MSGVEQIGDRHHSDTAPGDEAPGGSDLIKGVRGYLAGLALATLLSVVSFFVAGTTLVWAPSMMGAGR